MHWYYVCSEFAVLINHSCCIIYAVASVSSRHELGPSRGGSTGGERAGKAAKVDEEDFELVKTLMVTLTSLSCDQGTIKVSR